MGGPVISYSEYARSGAIVGDTPEQINEFLAQCLTLRKVLGAAVHPRAIGRLVELWPRAYVEVHHYPPRGQTVVRIYNRKPVEGDAGNGLEEASREAACSDDDQFSRKTGIRLAFGRALKAVPRP